MTSTTKRTHNYDEAFVEVGRRLRSKHWATKSDLGALIFWKRIRVGRWAADLLNVPEVEIKRKTATAFEPGLKDSERLDALDLPGLRARRAVASTLLAAWRPREFGVYDERAVGALTTELKIPEYSRELTRYFRTLRKLRDELSEIRPALGARDIDKGLFMLGRPQRPPSH